MYAIYIVYNIAYNIVYNIVFFIHIAYILDNLYNFSCFNILINKLNLDLLRCIILKMISDIRDRKLYYYNRQCFIFYPCFLS